MQFGPLDGPPKQHRTLVNGYVVEDECPCPFTNWLKSRVPGPPRDPFEEVSAEAMLRTLV